MMLSVSIGCEFIVRVSRVCVGAPLLALLVLIASLCLGPIIKLLLLITFSIIQAGVENVSD